MRRVYSLESKPAELALTDTVEQPGAFEQRKSGIMAPLNRTHAIYAFYGRQDGTEDPEEYRTWRTSNTLSRDESHLLHFARKEATGTDAYCSGRT